VTSPTATGFVFEEELRATGRVWWLLPVLVAVAFFAVAPLVAPIAAGAWFVNVLRFRKTKVRVDGERLWVGRRSLPLVALEPTTLGRAGNTWPWRVFSKRYLGANPIWTNDSVGMRGIVDRKPCWVAVGTNRREELVDALSKSVSAARARAQATSATTQALPPPAWHPDPWDPAARLRWWDGTQWTGYTAPRGPGSPPPGANPGGRV
jgi:hypothetical protein